MYHEFMVTRDNEGLRGNLISNLSQEQLQRKIEDHIKGVSHLFIGYAGLFYRGHTVVAITYLPATPENGYEIQFLNVFTEA